MCHRRTPGPSSGSVADPAAVRLGRAALADDPFEVDPADLHLIPVVGTVYEGRWFPVPEQRRAPVLRGADHSVAAMPHLPGLGCNSDDDATEGCSCQVARRLAEAYRRLHPAA